MKSALADSPHFRHTNFAVGAFLVLQSLLQGLRWHLRQERVLLVPVRQQATQPGIDQAFLFFVVDETTGPRELPQVAELLAARPEFEPVGLPSQHGLKYIWSRGISKKINRGRHSRFSMAHLVLLAKFRAGHLAGRAFPVACSGKSDLT